MTVRKPQSASDSQPWDAVDLLIDGLVDRIREHPKRLDFDDLLAAFRSRAGCDVGPVEVQARSIAGSYNAMIQRGGSLDGLVSLTLAKLGGVIAAADQVLTDWPEAPALAAAEAEVSQAEKARQDVLQALEAAVQAADVDEVTRLHAEAEVRAPQRVEAARLAVLDLQLARSTDIAEVPGKRLRVAKERRSAAEARHQSALAAVKVAERELEDAAWQQMLAERADSLIADGIAQLTRQRDAARAQAERSRNDRFRRLAGLPPADADETPAETDSETAFEGIMIRPQVATERTEMLDVRADVASPPGWTMPAHVVGAR